MESSRNTESNLKRQRNEHVRRLNQIEAKKTSLMINHKHHHHHHHHRKKSRPRQQEIHAEDVNEWGERVQTIELELKDTTHGQCRKRSLRRNRSYDAGIDLYRNQNGIGRTHSRCDLYLTLAAAYLVLICSIASTTNNDYSTASSSSRTAVLILSSLSFVLTSALGIRCVYKSACGTITTKHACKPPRPLTLVHITTPFISVFTYIASGMILYPRYDDDVILAEAAVTGNEVWNANIFYSSYICLYGSTYLMVKVFVQNDTIASVLSSIKILLSMALFSSMCNTISIMIMKHGPACYGYLDQLPYCSHAATAEVLGVWCIFISLFLCVATGCLELYHFSSTSRRETRHRGSRALRRNLQRSRTLLYLILIGGSTLLFILHCANVATVTSSSRGSDGSAFVTSWVAWIISLLLWKSSVVEFMNYIHSKALPVTFGMNKRDASTAENEHEKSFFDRSERSGFTDSTFEELYSDLESPLPPIGDTFILLPVQQKTIVQPEDRFAKNSSRQRKYRKAPTNETDCILHVQRRPDPIERELGSGDNTDQNSRRHLVAAQDDNLKPNEDLSSHDSDSKVVVPREKIHTSRRNLDRVGASSSSTGFVQRSSPDNRCHHQIDQPKSTEDLLSHDSDPKSVIPREKNHCSNLERAGASPLPYAYSTTRFVRRASLQSFKSTLSPLHEGSLESSLSRTGTAGSIKNPTPVPPSSNNLIRLSPSRKGRITKNNSLRMNKDEKQLKSYIVVTRTTTPPPPPPPPRRNINKNQRQGETNDKILRETSSPSPNFMTLKTNTDAKATIANLSLTKKKSKSFDCRSLSTTNTNQLQVSENHGNSIESDFIMSDIDILLSGGNSVVTELSEGTAKARESDLYTPPLMMSMLSVNVISSIHEAAVSANKKKGIDSTIKEWETSIRSTDEFLATSMRLNSRNEDSATPLTQNSAKHQSQRRGSVASLSSMKEALVFLHK